LATWGETDVETFSVFPRQHAAGAACVPSLGEANSEAWAATIRARAGAARSGSDAMAMRLTPLDLRAISV
jgi:hypothetical protein